MIRKRPDPPAGDPEGVPELRADNLTDHVTMRSNRISAHSKDVNTDTNGINSQSEDINTHNKGVDVRSEHINIRSKTSDTQSKDIHADSPGIEIRSEHIDTRSRMIDTQSEDINADSKGIGTQSQELVSNGNLEPLSNSDRAREIENGNTTTFHRRLRRTESDNSRTSTRENFVKECANTRSAESEPQCDKDTRAGNKLESGEAPEATRVGNKLEVGEAPEPTRVGNKLTAWFLDKLGVNRDKFEVTGERDSGVTVENAIAVIRFEKIDPNLDANNNSGDVEEDKYAAEDVRKEDNGNAGDPGVKKKMDSDDDTRPIIPRVSHEDEPDIPETEIRLPNLINWWTWIAYSQGHVYNDLCASMWFTYLMPFLQKCMGLRPQDAGLLMLIGQVADALATPVVGLFSDRGSSAWYCGLGRRKTWHILGTALVTVSFPFIFSPAVFHINLVLYFIPFIVLFQFGWASVQIAHLSLVPDLTPNENERTSLLSVRYAFTVISNLLVYVIMYFAVEHGSSDGGKNLGPNDSSKFQYISYIVVGLGYISTLTFYMGVSEIHSRQLQLNLRQSSSTQMYESRKRTIGQLMRMPTLYTVAVLYMTARMFFNILQMFIVFYVGDTLDLDKNNIAIVPLVILLSGFISSLGVKQINVLLGRKWSHLIGLALGVLVSTVVFIDVAQNASMKSYIIYLIAILYGLSSTVIQVTSFGMAADFVGDDVSNGAFIYGILSFADKTSNGVVGYVIQALNPNDNKDYYRLALAYGAGLPCLLGILALVFLTPLPQVKLKSTDPPDDDRLPVTTTDDTADNHHTVT